MMTTKILTFFLLTLGLGGIAEGKKKDSFLPNSFHAVFEQQYKSSLSGKMKKSKGTLDYRFPGSMKLETTYPDKITFVSNPTYTWYYTAPFMEGEAGELTKKPTSKNVLSKFFDSLKKGLVSNKIYKVSPVKDAVSLNFSKNSAKELGIKKAVLFFNGKSSFKNLKKVKLTYTDKKTVELSLSQIKMNAKFTPKYFIFVPPKNTRINR